MTIQWYFNRLRSMSPAEIAFRFVEKGRQATARNRLEGWKAYESEGTALPVVPGLRDAFLSRAQPQAKAAIARAASRLLAGEYETLGVAWPKRDADDLFPADVWRLDPVSGEHWPGADIYCFDIRYRHERRLGDVKYVWEFNRLQFLQILAAEVALADDAQALAAIETAIESWQAANPPFRGTAWNSGIELALRSISLLVVASLCEGRLQPKTVGSIRRILRAHGRWMQRFPSRFSSANNHLVAEAAGEFLIGLGFAACGQSVPEAAALEAGGRRVLEAEAARQILADGVPAEQSPTYGAFTAEFLTLSLQAAAGAGRPLAPVVEERLRRFADFVATLADAHGNVPAIGDDDEGKVIAAESHEETYAASIAHAILASTGGQAWPATNLRGLVLGDAALPDRSRSGLTSFREGGYSVVREVRAGREVALCFDHGPLGYLAIAAHGHADALAFTLTLDDEPIFVDPGTYLYHAGGHWRDAFRGTGAHNTLAVGDADQSVISGPFNWSHKARARLDGVQPIGDWSLDGSHDGYEARFGVRHRRRIAATATGISIEDRLDGTLPRETPVTVSFMLAPGCLVERDGEGLRILSPAGRSLAFGCNHPAGLVVEAPEAEKAWFSGRFGRKEPTGAIRWRGRTMPSPLAFDIRF